MSEVVLVTGSAGLIGSEAVRFYCKRGYRVVGIDNNARRYFFGDLASTAWNNKLLRNEYSSYVHLRLDIRNQRRIDEVFRQHPISLVIHTAGQPSHDWAAKEPLTDFSINALGTHILLEACRKHRPESVFIFTSTNKVYGDNPNRLPLVEQETRFEISSSHANWNGVNEQMSLDDCTHSIFGVSKTAADLMVQEYGRYFGMKTGIFRGGCLTGPAHSPAQLHGFLAYLVSAIVRGIPYTVLGYKGKQVRDNIHASDVINAFDYFYRHPRPGEVYNLGGSRHSNVSILEAVKKIEAISGKQAKIIHSDQNRVGDHIWYISDVAKFKSHYPQWQYTYDNDRILEELCRHARETQAGR